MITLDKVFTEESMSIYDSIANSFVSKYGKLIYPGSSEDVLAELYCTLVTERDYYEQRSIDIDLKYLVWLSKKRLIDTFITGRTNKNNTSYRPFIFELIKSNGKVYYDIKQLAIGDLEIYQIIDTLFRIDKLSNLGFNVSSDHTAILFRYEYGINDSKYDELISRLYIDSLVSALNNGEIFIIKSLFLDGYTQLELAKLLKVSISWISQCSQAAIDKIKACLKEKDNVDFT